MNFIRSPMHNARYCGFTTNVRQVSSLNAGVEQVQGFNVGAGLVSSSDIGAEQVPSLDVVDEPIPGLNIGVEQCREGSGLGCRFRAWMQVSGSDASAGKLAGLNAGAKQVSGFDAGVEQVSGLDATPKSILGLDACARQILGLDKKVKCAREDCEGFTVARKGKDYGCRRRLLSRRCDVVTGIDDTVVSSRGLVVVDASLIAAAQCRSGSMDQEGFQDLL
ncbi:hypothetical protein E2542_SST22568 [Spatholobus suberectus]|nr:hypothetical protein E2542_SST22568 [Spatholobus suberectus]